MANIETEMTSIDQDWGGIVDLGQGIRIGFGDRLILLERTRADGSVGVYNLAHIPDDKVEAFFEWLASQR